MGFSDDFAKGSWLFCDSSAKIGSSEDFVNRDGFSSDFGTGKISDNFEDMWLFSDDPFVVVESLWEESDVPVIVLLSDLEGLSHSPTAPWNERKLTSNDKKYYLKWNILILYLIYTSLVYNCK